MTSSGQTKHMPKDAQVIMSILKDMGVIEYEPQVVHQLLEFTYRYVTGVLEDARAYSSHANKKSIDLDDVQLAVQMQMDKSFTTPPPRDVLLNLARAKNSLPLPSIKPHCGIRLPPDRYCMTACNYELKSSKKPAGSTVKGNTSFVSGGGVSSSIIKPQVKPVAKRATMSTIAKTQTITMNKPILKITPAMHPSSNITVVSSDDISHTWKAKVQLPQGHQNVIMDVDEPSATIITDE